MAKRMKRLLVALAACAALGTGGAVFAQAQSQPATGSESPSAVDRDNIQSGDQTTPDAPAAKAASAKSGSTAASQSEPAGSTEKPGAEGPEQPGTESESAPNSDGPGGHADEPGNAGADHQAQGVE